MCLLANAQWDQPAGGNTGQIFLFFGGLVCADWISNCPLDRVLTYKFNLLNKFAIICVNHVMNEVSPVPLSTISIFFIDPVHIKFGKLLLFA